MQNRLFERFSQGQMNVAVGSTDLGALPWSEHKDFAGVYLKNVLSGEYSQGLLTCHLVRLEPGAVIGRHIHAGALELHEVVEGDGVCLTPEGEIPYAPGSMAVIACNVPHEVRAGAQGLCLLAKFVTVPGD